MPYFRPFAVLVLTSIPFTVMAEQSDELVIIEMLGLSLMMLGILLATIGCVLDRGSRQPKTRVERKEISVSRLASLFAHRA